MGIIAISCHAKYLRTYYYYYFCNAITGDHIVSAYGDMCVLLMLLAYNRA